MLKGDYMATSTYAAAGLLPWSVAQSGRNLGLPLCLPCRVGKSPSERNVDAAMGVCARMGRGRPSYSVDMDEACDLLPKEDRKWDRFRTANKNWVFYEEEITLLLPRGVTRRLNLR